MPILPQEVDLWPENAFEHKSNTASRWSVLYSRSRSEKALARHLRDLHVTYYLPVRRTVKRYQRRTVVSSVPLFPGYLFARVTEEERAVCRRFRECAGELQVADEDLLQKNLIDLRRILASGLPVTREERLKPGMLVRITKGPLTDLCGRVLKNRRGIKFVLEVQFINQGISIEIDGDSIEAV